MPAYLLRRGEGKIVALHTRCEDESLCRAELLMLLGEVDARVPPALAHGPVHGYYDVDPTFTRDEFLAPYCRDAATCPERVEGPAPRRAPGPPAAAEPPAGPRNTSRVGT